jgi:hypothetical protein
MDSLREGAFWASFLILGLALVGCSFAFLELDEEDAAAGAHGWSSAAPVDAEQVDDGGELAGVVAGEVGEALKGGGFNNGAGVVQIGLESGGGPAAIWWGERQAAEGEGEIPA